MGRSIDALPEVGPALAHANMSLADQRAWLLVQAPGSARLDIAALSVEPLVRSQLRLFPFRPVAHA